MKNKKYIRPLIMIMVLLLMSTVIQASAAPTKDNTNGNGITKGLNLKKVTPADRKAAADKLQLLLEEAGLTTMALPAGFGTITDPATGYLVPDYFGNANWAYSPIVKKFVDELAGLGKANENALGQYIPLAIPDTTTYPDDPATGAKASDYYEIAVVEYMEKMHSEIPETKNRGYVQIDTAAIPGDGVPLFQADGITPIYYPGTTTQVMVVDKPHYLGPAIVSDSNRPVRIKFYNLLPIGVAGDLYIPVDRTVMGSGMGPTGENYTENRANVHLHGNNTVWISDGSPHQWITPAGEDTPYPQGTSVVGVPDMEDPNNPRDGTTTLYYTNSQSARLMFYHDHSFGITRLNVYAGEAAPYIIRDDVEKDLINGTNLTGVNPNGFKLPEIEIPLVIQDRTFVDAATILDTDPTWAWGTNPATPATVTTPYIPGSPRTGDLWYPHVYSPAQNPYNVDGANPYGRWMYGPWFYPPTENIAHPPVPNPYYDVNISPTDPSYRPPLMPGTPNPSAPGESFMDTPLVNGTVYPYLEVDPQTYRFRILNAANDRFFNLSMYVADDTYQLGDAGYLTEVKMMPAIPGELPLHINQRVPDPGLNGENLGPNWIQIGSEGGFLPTPVIIEPQYTTWNLVGTAFNFGVVDKHSLLLGTAERADVIVDFSQYAGKTLILYNDAPAPFPANDTRYDYFTGNPGQEDIGGAPETMPGYGPNTRTIMQIRVADKTPAPVYDTQPLFDVFEKGKIPATAAATANTGVFATSQDTVIIPQAAYNKAYGVTNLPADARSAYVQLDENSKTFSPIDNNGNILEPVTLPLEPKAMHDEMSGVFDEFGRMSGFLGLTSPKASATAAPFLAYGYSSPPVDLFKGIDDDLDAVMIGSADDGTQIWQITHNGVDTHTIHTHLFSSQLVNRVAWDGAMMAPDDNELGWKETYRVNPLEQTVIAMRPKVPAASEIPFKIPNSVRLLDPTMPVGAVLPTPPPESWFDPQGNIIAQVVNHEVNFGWEYVYHCHILSHEEMDMMHSMAVSVKPLSPTILPLTTSGSGNNKTVVLTWVDNSSNETGFTVQRALSAAGPWTTLATVPANTLTYSNRIGNTNTAYFYKVTAVNTVGDTQTPGFPTVTTKSADSEIVTTGTAQAGVPGSPTNLTATVQIGPQVLLNWTDNANNESGFIIERAVNGGAYSILTTAAPKSNTGAVSYTDMDVLPGSQYDYRVAAINATGQSAYSNIATVTIDAPPAAPSLVNATAFIASKRNAKVTLTWTDNAVNETGFTIERCTNATFTGPNLITVNVAANLTTYTTGNVERNTPYYFRIRANNSVGSSVWVNANPLPVTTP